MLYREYLKVESDFIPVFSAGNDKTHPESWKSFYPHESFKRILTLTLDTLEKGSALNDRPLWVSGSYGTGKTFASFVIKHILEDRLEVVEEYFARYELKPLFDRLVGLRNKGNILVVHQSSSAGIDSQSKLFNTIIGSVKRTLLEKGYSYTGAASMTEKILATLKDSDSAFNFSAAFRKYRDTFLSYRTPHDVIADLETLRGQEQLDLLEDIVAVAEKESYNWSISVYDLIERLRDIRSKNNLYAVVFIWDEFTEYFFNNRNNISGLQEIAQNASEISFYFFLLTHSDDKQLITDSVQRKVVEARFKIASISLAQSSAFQLLAQALSVEPDLQDEWEKISSELWESVARNAAEFILKRDDSVKSEDFRKLLPLHPYAAWLLKFLAQAVSSNQRTMFKFLCTNQDGSFKNFLDGHGFEYGGDNLLTADSLWDYFFQENNPDIDESFLEIMSCYSNFSLACKNHVQQRILKTTLLLNALQRKSNVGRDESGTSLMRSTRKNICACFAGTPLEKDVFPTLDYFVDKGIVSTLEEGADTVYLLSTATFDTEHFENIVSRMRHEYSFDAIIHNAAYNPSKSFLPTDYLKYRCVEQIISPTKYLKTSGAKLLLADNQIIVFYIFVGDESEQGNTNRAIQKIKKEHAARCIIVDFSAVPFTKQRYDKFLQNKAREVYFSDIPNQTSQARLAKKTTDKLVAEWIQQLEAATVQVLSSVDNSTSVSGTTNFWKLLRELNKHFYGCGLESLSVNDNLFAPNKLTENVAKYALDTERVKGSSGWLNFVGDSYRELKERGGDNYWLTIPSHPISKIKILVERFIENSFATHHSISLAKLWSELKKSPVGLFKCPGSIFLLTLLLKDYADKNFYVRDGNGCTQLLSGERLCTLVVNTVKELSGANDKFIVKQTVEHVKFCLIVSEIFGLDKEKVTSVDEAVKRIKNRLVQIHYPLCLLQLFVADNYRENQNQASLLRFLDLLSELMTPRERAVMKVADEIFFLLDKKPSVVAELKNILQEKNFRDAALDYVSRYTPALNEIVGRLQLSEAEFRTRLDTVFSTDKMAYLCRFDDVKERICFFQNELLLTDAINGVLPSPQKNLSEARRALNDKLNKIRIPRSLVEEFQPELKSLFEIVTTQSLNSDKNFAAATEQIKKSAPTFLSFFEHQFKFFSTALEIYIPAAQAYTERLFNEAPTGIFFKTRDDFILHVQARVKTFRQSEKNAEFFDTWKEITFTPSPAEWSNQNEIPILCAFQDCLEEAQSCFSALNKKSHPTTEAALDAAMNFIRSDKIFRLADKENCKRLFVNYFCGENYSVVVDTDNLKKILRQRFGSDVYSWFSNKKNSEALIKALAEKNYREHFLTLVREKVRALSAAQAKKYLEELINKDTLLGIRVLKNAGGHEQ